MYKPYYLFIASKYLSSKSKSGFISFISTISIIGISLGVASLITVVSVMNGFHQAIKQKLLQGAPHVNISINTSVDIANVLTEDIKNEINDIKEVFKTSATQALLSSSSFSSAAMVKGVSPRYLEHFNVKLNSKYNFTDKYSIVLGKQLMKNLNLEIGDKIKLVSSGKKVMGKEVARMKDFTIIGIFDVNYWMNHKVVLTSIDNVNRLSSKPDFVENLEVKLKNPMLSTSVREAIQNKFPTLAINDWTMIHKDFFDTIQMETNVMYVVLTLMVLVATFNLLSSLMMLVNEKRKQIAILRTMGASKFELLLIFITQGALIGIVGTTLGLLLGLLLSINAPEIVEWIGQVLGTEIINESVYLVNKLPVKIQFQDICSISIITVILSTISTLYPAIAATRISPAEALKHE